MEDNNIDETVLALQNYSDILNDLERGVPKEEVLSRMIFRGRLILLLGSYFNSGLARYNGGGALDRFIDHMSNDIDNVTLGYPYNITPRTFQMPKKNSELEESKSFRESAEWIVNELKSLEIEDDIYENLEMDYDFLFVSLYEEFKKNVHPVELCREVVTQLSDLSNRTGNWGKN